MTEAEILTQYAAWSKQVNHMTDQEILTHIRHTKARGLEPWWTRRREYLTKAGREHLIKHEGLAELEWRADRLQTRTTTPLTRA